jgi:hypothetical protein
MVTVSPASHGLGEKVGVEARGIVARVSESERLAEPIVPGVEAAAERLIVLVPSAL